MQFFNALIFIAFLLPQIGKCSIFEQVIPKPNTCWYLNSDKSELGFAVNKNLQKSSYMIVNWSKKFTRYIFNLNCDGHIFVRKNVEKAQQLFWSGHTDLSALNQTTKVDTRLFLIYQGDSELSDVNVGEFLKKVIFNMVFIRAPRGQHKRRGLYDYNIKELHAFAPLSGQKAVFKRNSVITRGNIMASPELEGLFRSQVWDPVKRNAILHVTYIVYRPFSVLLEDGQVDGIKYRIIKGCTTGWNLKYFPYNVEKHGFNQEEIAKKLNDGEADVVTAADCLDELKPDTEEVPYVYESTCTAVLVPKPKPVNPDAYLFLSLRASVWFCFIFIFVVVSILICIIARFDNNPADVTDSLFRQYSFCVICLIDIVCGHGIPFPKSRALKIVLFSWMIVCMLVIIAYCTGYSSFLTEHKYTTRIKTIDQMVNTGIYWSALDIEEGNKILRHMMNSSHKTMLRVFADRMDPWPKEGYPEVERRIRSEGRAIVNRILNQKYLLDVRAVQNITATDIMQPLEECINTCFLVIRISPRSPFVYALQRRLYAATETGLVAHWIDEFLRQDKKMLLNRRKVEEPPRALKLKDVRGMFLLLFIGYSLAGSCFIAESIWQLRKPIRGGLK